MRVFNVKKFGVCLGLLSVALLATLSSESGAMSRLPGEVASADLLDRTTARAFGTCVTDPTGCTVTWMGAANYCTTTYGTGGGFPPPWPPAACSPNTAGTPRPCGNCNGPAHVYCESAPVATKCCIHYGKCCRPPKECKTNAAGCSCVTATLPQAITGIRYLCYSGAAGPTAPCTP